MLGETVRLPFPELWKSTEGFQSTQDTGRISFHTVGFGLTVLYVDVMYLSPQRHVVLESYSLTTIIAVKTELSCP